MTRSAVVLLALAIGLTIAACGGGGPPATTETAAQPATRVSVALDWVPNPDHVGLLVAKERGLFAERGLDVDLRTPSDPTAGVKLVATNQTDLAIYYEGDTFFAAEEGLPVVAVGALIPTALNSLIALPGSRVEGAGSVAGATIGVAGLPFDDAIVDTLEARAGLDEAEIRVVNVGYDLVPALLAGKVDAVIGAYWNVEGAQLELERGEPPTVVRLDELGVPPYDELVIVANRDRLRSDPGYADAVRGFLAAMVAGTEAAQADVAAATDVVAAGTDYDRAFLDVSVPLTIEATRPPAGRHIGCLDLRGWQAFGRWMLESDLLEQPIDVGTIATNEYLAGCE